MKKNFLFIATLVVGTFLASCTKDHGIDCSAVPIPEVVGQVHNPDGSVGPGGATISYSFFETYSVSNGPGNFKVVVSIPGRPDLNSTVQAQYSDLTNLVSFPVSFVVPNSTANPDKTYAIKITGRTGLEQCNQTTTWNVNGTVGANKGAEKSGITEGSNKTTAMPGVIFQEQ